jgi:hypothetical protein
LTLSVIRQLASQTAQLDLLPEPASQRHAEGGRG